MRRHHLVELEDLEFTPAVLRNGLTNFLTVAIRIGAYYDEAVPMLADAVKRTHDDRIVDLCSGAGGPWPVIFSRFQQLHPGLRVFLSDYHPNEDAMLASRKHQEGIEAVGRSVDATNVPAELTGFRTFFTSFHHFRPEQARKILADAVAKRQGIAIFECTERSWRGLLWMSLSAFGVWFLTPFIRPVSWAALFLTYIVPIIPLMVTFDGVISCLRTYTVAELRQLAAGLGNDYTWDAGQVKGPRSPVPLTFLIGTPRTAEDIGPNLRGERRLPAIRSQSPDRL